MNISIWFGVAVATVGLWCGLPVAQAQGAKLPVRVACVGDSITFGAGIAGGDEKYPTILGKMLGSGYEVQNFGNSGKTAGDFPGQVGRWYGSTKEHAAALEFKGDVYICNLGINDTGRWFDAKLCEKGYDDLLVAWKGANPKAHFLLWGKLGPDFRGPVSKKAFPGNVFPDTKYKLADNGSAQNRPTIEKCLIGLAKKHHAKLFDAYTTQATHPEWYPDGLHPNGGGAKRIAEITFAQLAGYYPLGAEKPLTVTAKDTEVVITNPNDRAVLLDGYTLVLNTARHVFSNITIIHAQESLTVTLGTEAQIDPTKPITLKAKPANKAILTPPPAKK